MLVAAEGTKVVLSRGNQLRVPLSVDEAEDVAKQLPEAIKAAKEYDTDAGKAKRLAELRAEQVQLEKELKESQQRAELLAKEERKRQGINKPEVKV